MKKSFLLLIGFLGMFAMTGFTQNTLATNQNQQILDMLEEEKLANDVYLAMFEKWQHHSFKNISAAEQHHLDLMKQLAIDNKLAIPPSVEKQQTGVFKNTGLQKLYDQLIEEGNKSLVDALKTGAKIEELDIRDLKAAIANTDHVSAIQTYTILMNASENHLRAFHRNLDRMGINYTPIALANEDYQAIISGKNTCAGTCCQNISGVGKSGCKNGPGKGKGPGACCSSK